MGKFAYLEYPIVSNNKMFYILRFIPTIELNKCEVDILRFLAENGPHSILELAEGVKIPKVAERGRPLLKYKREKIPRRDETKKLEYHYSSLHRHVIKLLKKGLVRYGERKAELTFDGIVLYLRMHWEGIRKTGLKQAINLHPKLLPFFKNWNQILKTVGEDRGFDTLIRTAQATKCLDKTKFRIERLNLQFEAFLESPERLVPKSIKGKRDENFAKFLSTRQELRNAYVSYLAVQDLPFILKQEKPKIDFLYTLESERELAFFENRDINVNPLFLGDRLKEFFPEYAAIEYFFTGKLMKNLLWPVDIGLN